MSHAHELVALILDIRSTGPDHLVVDRVVAQLAAAERLVAGNRDSDPLQDRRDALNDALRRYENGLDVAGADADAQRFADLGEDLRRGASVAGTLRRIVTTYTAENQNAEVAAEFIDVVFPPAAAAAGVR